MPTIARMPEADLAKLEQGGGLKPRTLAARQRELQFFLDYWQEEGLEHPTELVKTEEGCEKFSKELGRYFFQYRVKGKAGDDLWPKRETAQAVRSRLKSELIAKFKIDITDPIMFPDNEKKWKALVTEIVAAGRNETKHHEEVYPETMLAIYQLLGKVVEVLKTRGTPDYARLLASIPADLQGRLHEVLQWGAIFILMMFEVRRGVENLEFLEAPDFMEIRDQLWDFQYFKNTKSEAEKNNPGGNNSRCHGVIPDLLIADVFNPFDLFKLYKSLIPVVPNQKSQKVFLFPKPRRASRKFSPHDDTAPLYEWNQKVGKNTISNMLPKLCQFTGSPRQTNHCVRATMVMYLRRAGFAWEDIIKITGHHSTVTLVKNYDLKLEARGLAEMAGALAHGPKEALGEDIQRVKLGKRKAEEDTSMEQNSREEISPRSKEEVASSTKKVAPSTEEVAPGIKEMAPGIKEMAPSTKEEVPSTKKVSSPEEEVEDNVAEAWPSWDEAEASQTLDVVKPSENKNEAWEDWDEAAASQTLDDLVAMYDEESWKPWDEQDAKKTMVKAEEEESKKNESTSRGLEVATMMEEAKLVEQMMGTVVRQAVEGGSHLIQTWLNRKSCN